MYRRCYGVATISRLLKIIGLFCRIQSLLWGSFAKETYNLKEPTNRSHSIAPEIHDLWCDTYERVMLHTWMISVIAAMIDLSHWMIAVIEMISMTEIIHGKLEWSQSLLPCMISVIRVCNMQWLRSYMRRVSARHVAAMTEIIHGGTCVSETRGSNYSLLQLECHYYSLLHL